MSSDFSSVDIGNTSTGAYCVWPLLAYNRLLITFLPGFPSLILLSFLSLPHSFLKFIPWSLRLSMLRQLRFRSTPRAHARLYPDECLSQHGDAPTGWRFKRVLPSFRPLLHAWELSALRSKRKQPSQPPPCLLFFNLPSHPTPLGNQSLIPLPSTIMES